MKELTIQESHGLVIIRVFAMLSIVVCHLFQSYNLGLAGLFNIGVQVFFVLSGYLYGTKMILDWKNWAKKRIHKIYLPYFVFLILVIPLYAFFHPEVMRWKWLPIYFLNLDGFRFLLGSVGESMTIEGLRHVWFLTAIMVAYFTTPLLQHIRNASKEKLTIVLLLVLTIAGYLILPMHYMFVIAWVYLYSFGYLLASLKDSKLVIIILFVGAFATAILRYPFHHLSIWNPVNRIFHDVWGIFLVVFPTLLCGIKSVGYAVNRLFKIKWLSSLVLFFDKYSFYIYIVHFIIICGPFSMAHITSHIGLNVIMMLLTTAAATFLFVNVLKFFEKAFRITET